MVLNIALYCVFKLTEVSVTVHTTLFQNIYLRKIHSVAYFNLFSLSGLVLRVKMQRTATQKKYIYRFMIVNRHYKAISQSYILLHVSW